MNKWIKQHKKLFDENYLREHIEEINPRLYCSHLRCLSNNFVREFRDRINWYETRKYIGIIKKKDNKFYQEIKRDVKAGLNRNYWSYMCGYDIFPRSEYIYKHYLKKYFHCSVDGKEMK